MKADRFSLNEKETQLILAAHSSKDKLEAQQIATATRCQEMEREAEENQIASVARCMAMEQAVDAQRSSEVQSIRTAGVQQESLHAEQCDQILAKKQSLELAEAQ